MKEKAIDFKNGKISTLFGRLFFPTLIGMLSVSAVTAIDGIFIGKGIGSDAIAAVNICIPILMLLTGFGLMLGMGSSVVASIALSKGKRKIARAAVTNALLLVSIVSCLANLIVLIFPREIAYALGASDRLLPMVIDYLLWFAPSLIFSLLICVSVFALRLDGKPKLVLWATLTASVLNVALDWLFIFPLDCGIAGAAFATFLSCIIAALIPLIYLFFYADKLRLSALKLNKKGLKFFLSDIYKQCQIGSSAMLGEATLAVLFFVGNHAFMSYLGEDGVGAFGIACYYLPFIFMVGNSIAQSAQPIISYNFGIANRQRVRSALSISIQAAFICGIISTAFFTLFPEILVGLFLDIKSEVAKIAIKGFPYFGSAATFFIMNLTFIGYCQSIERVKTAACFAVLRGFVFLIPAFMLLPRFLGERGLWLSLCFSELLTSMAIAGVCLVAFLGRRASGRQFLHKLFTRT